MTLGWDRTGDPTHHDTARGRDWSCALRMLEMDRVAKWFTSHTRADSHRHEKVGPSSQRLLSVFRLFFCTRMLARGSC